MGEHHRVDQPEPIGQPPGHLLRNCLQDADGGKQRPQDLDVDRKANVQPVRDHGVGDEAAADRIERNQSCEPSQRAEPPESHRTARSLDSRAQEKRQRSRDDSDRCVKKKERSAARGAGRQRRGQAACGVEQAARHGVPAESNVAAGRRRRFGKHRLLHRREWPEVDAGRAEHAGEARRDQQRRLSRQRQVQPGQRHEQARDR